MGISADKVVALYKLAVQFGTCSICKRNIKLKGGKISRHGHRQRGVGMGGGECSGSWFEPLEVSNEGLVETARVLRNTLESYKNRLQDPATSPRDLGKAKRGIPVLEKKIQSLEAEARNWKPSQLETPTESPAQTSESGRSEELKREVKRLLNEDVVDLVNWARKGRPRPGNLAKAVKALFENVEGYVRETGKSSNELLNGVATKRTKGLFSNPGFMPGFKAFDGSRWDLTEILKYVQYLLS